MDINDWRIINPSAGRRVVVTRMLPGSRWIEILSGAGCRVEICTQRAGLSADQIRLAIGPHCDGVIGQLTERWDAPCFAVLKQAGARIYSNYAVGYNNLDLQAATACRIAVGNTPGVLTEATAEMAAALTLAAARRLGEAERYLRAGRFDGWQPDLLLGELLWRQTVGVVGAGRIGSAYARMMMEGHRADILYFGRHPNPDLERFAAAYNRFLAERGETPLRCRWVEDLDALLAEADCVSLHTALDAGTRHLIDARRLALMKPNAVLINTSRGPVIDEAALVAHCRRHPDFRAGLDVFEDEPRLAPGLSELDNVVIVPHIASATGWTRRGMAILAARNVAAVLAGDPVWNRPDISCFFGDDPPRAAPSILNAEPLGLDFWHE